MYLYFLMRQCLLFCVLYDFHDWRIEEAQYIGVEPMGKWINGGGNLSFSPPWAVLRLLQEDQLQDHFPRRCLAHSLNYSIRLCPYLYGCFLKKLLVVSLSAWHTCVCSCSVVSHSFWPPWTLTHQAPLSIGFSRQEYWSGLPFCPPGDLPDPGIKTHASCVYCIGRWILYH